MLLAGSLINGFMVSNFIGRLIVLVQLACSVVLLLVSLGKFRQLAYLGHAARRFAHDFAASHDVLEYYLQRRPTAASGFVGIYKVTCERLLRLLTPDVRALVAGRQAGSENAALTAREIELVRGTCEHILDEEELRLKSRVSWITSIVMLAPMLGLLGTVWGVLDAFFEMGSAGSANLATIAPSISAALVTTVVGLLVAIPGAVMCSWIQGSIRRQLSDMEGFCDELMGRIACEFQGRGA